MLISPFPDGYRGSGLLLHVTSLPSRYGIGDLGPAAYHWIDLLANAGQTWWQILPLGPTGFGNSPYQPTSVRAANPLLISPDLLFADGLVERADIEPPDTIDGAVDFDAARSFKTKLVRTVSNHLTGSSNHSIRGEYEQFQEQHGEWLDDFALFECLHRKLGTGAFWQWPAELAQRDPEALEAASRELSSGMQQVRCEQFLVSRQIAGLKEYAHSKGVRLIGDLPFFVSPESADVWTHPELFQLDAQQRPAFVAGVPPDYFSPTGQLWGNPVFHWEAHRETGYAWWLQRIKTLLNQVDVIRLDHFRGFAAAWHIPADADSALQGEWRPGPGADFFRLVQSQLGHLPFLAEDLGQITDDVTELRDQFQLSGMRVLQFAFDGKPDNPFLPANYVPNTVAYTATHDNDTSRGWVASLDRKQRQAVRQFLGQRRLKPTTVAFDLLRTVWSSSAALTIAPVQDVLNLDTHHRMNTPGKATGNWSWQMTPETLDSKQFQVLQDLTRETNREGGLAGRSSAFRRSEEWTA